MAIAPPNRSRRQGDVNLLLPPPRPPLLDHASQTLMHEFLERRAIAGRDFPGLPKKGVGNIDGRLHIAKNI